MLLKMFARFSVIGLSGVGVNMAVYIPLTALGVNYITAALLAFVVAVSNNFVWNVLWTFKGRAGDKSLKQKYISFVACNIINLVANLMLLKVLVEQFAIDATMAQIIAVGITGALNFALNYAITFSDRGRKPEEETHEACNYSDI